MRITSVILVGGLMACQTASEKMIEAATGGAVKIEGGNVTVKGENGEVVSVRGGEGKLTVTNEQGETATITGDAQGVKVVSKEGTAQWGATTLPDGFPLKVVDGGKLISASNSTGAQGQTFMVMVESTKSPKEVGEFYAAELKAKGLKVERHEINADGKLMITLAGKGDGIESGIMVASADEGPGCSATITWAKK